MQRQRQRLQRPCDGHCHTGVDGVSVTRCRTVVAEAVGDDVVYIDLDGEQPGTLPARWEVVPACIDLLV